MSWLEGLFGKIKAEDFIQDPIVISADFGMLAITLGIIAIITYYKLWKYIWNEWLTSLDPKKIGVMYVVVILLMLFKCVVDAFMMRTQLTYSVGDSHGYLTATHFQELFSAHGTGMIFFVGMGAVFALMNFLVPLQIGARDVAYPFLNAMSFWLFAFASMFIYVSMIIGRFHGAGWLAYPPLSGIEYNPGVGVDYWIWLLQIAGVGSMLAAINFLVTIFKMRAPGMTFMRMPIFIWAAIATLVLIIFAFPVLTATLYLLALDRYMGMHFFTADAGGNPMLYINLIWAWGHPEVYILVLPAFGIYSEIVATYSQKRLFGYVGMVWAIAAIAFLSFVVWLHHFFTMGASPDVNAFFGVATMLIAIPTGVKIFNWLFTMYGGRVQMTAPMLWFLGFIFIFTQGGMTGVLLSLPPADFQFHNSLFLIAHFHSMVIGGLLFGVFAAIIFWFPKFSGLVLNDKIGRYAFGCWFTGFMFAFMPLYILGLMGATRRLDHYEHGTGWQPLYILAEVGILFIILGIVLQNWQIIYTVYHRKKYRDLTGDPWNGRTLEWATSSPPPKYNFAIIPNVVDRDNWWVTKQNKQRLTEKPVYEDIVFPNNSPMGLYIGIAAFIMGFGLIWFIWWLAILGFIGIIIFSVLRTMDDHPDEIIPAEEVKKIEEQIAKKAGRA